MENSKDFAHKLMPIIEEIRYQSGSFWYRQLKEELLVVENMMKTKSIIDYKVLFTPFINAIVSNAQVFQIYVINFVIVFSSDFPLEDIPLQFIFKILHKIVPFKSDIFVSKCVEMISSILNNTHKDSFLHSEILSSFVLFLSNLYSYSETKASSEMILGLLKSFVHALLKNYENSPTILCTSSIAEISQSISKEIITNSLIIMKNLSPIIANGHKNLSIIDSDIFSIISVICKIIEDKSNNMGCKWALLFLLDFLQQKSSFFKSPTFVFLLNNVIHVSFLSLFLKGSVEFATITSKILLVIWLQYSKLYMSKLYSIFNEGLGTNLTSPDQMIVIKALSIYRKLSSHPQLFVDMFVNYDCDRSGFFGNIFENTIQQIVRISNPDRIEMKSQPYALQTLIIILKSLWQYFSNFELSNTLAEAPQDFLEAKKTKAKLDVCLDHFKRDPKRGLKSLISNGFVNDNPGSIAKFFFDTPSLDPAAVGTILGTESMIETLKAYIQSFNFVGVSFENSFRMFLQKFHIPGEAQMIDRIMEQFGTKFYLDNPKLFSCADTVYVLAFSSLMLFTDAYNPNVKKRMTLEQFIDNNKGIDNGKNLPRELLEDLYKDITSKRLPVNHAVAPSSSLLSREQRAELYQTRCQQTIEDAKAHTVITSREFHRSESPLFIGPMFQVIWGGVMATLVMSLEHYSDPEKYSMCLDGLSFCVHIASHCFVEIALDTLVDSFSKFTNLHKSLNELKIKNIDCTNALLRVAIDDKNFLRGAWEIVLSEISALDRIKEKIPIIDHVLIDELFMATDTLDRESIADFLKALCATSKLELKENPPRIFSLQKLAVVAHFNMKRPRFIWLSIWNTIGDHLKEVGLLQDKNLSDITIDIIRQLAQKFLYEPELSHFHFQEHFLQPFLQIFEQHQLIGSKMLVIDCLISLVKELSEKIFSGWSIIFQIIELSTSGSADLKSSGFILLSMITKEKLNHVTTHYRALVSLCLLFINNPNNDEMLEAAYESLSFATSLIPPENSDLWKVLIYSIQSFYDKSNKSKGFVLEIFYNFLQKQSNNQSLWELIISFSIYVLTRGDKLSFQFINRIMESISQNKQLLMQLLLKAFSIPSKNMQKLVIDSLASFKNEKDFTQQILQLPLDMKILEVDTANKLVKIIEDMDLEVLYHVEKIISSNILISKSYYHILHVIFGKIDENGIMQITMRLIRLFVQNEESYEEAMILSLQKLISFSPENIEKHIKPNKSSLIQLVLINSKPVREELYKLFLTILNK